MPPNPISVTLAAIFPLDKRLRRSIDTWQQLMPGPLLRAALFNIDTADVDTASIEAELDVSDLRQRQLLPQLHANISAQLPKSMAVALKKIRLESFVRNKTYLGELPELAFCLAQVGIPLLALKGAALASTYYQDIGCRPLGDLDLLVPECDMVKAIDAITAEGWRPIHELSRQQYYINARFYHALCFEHPNKLVRLDLHIHCNHSVLWPNIDEPYWQRALPLADYDGVLRLSDTDNLMQVCNHGISQNFDSPVRWAMDAYLIMTKGSDGIDWDWIVDNANRTFIAPQLLLAFMWLQQELQLDIPERVITELGNASYDYHGLKAWAYRLDKPLGVVEIINSHWHIFSLSTKHLSVLETVALVPTYCKVEAHRQSFTAATAEVLMKLSKRLTRRLRNDK
jgi:hypothetical protein